ncbi:MAG: glutamine--fructose-6-phosphate transaminase (isomerizing) [Clostridiales bacterium]|nr:glutamine--fructose-6-phosphate transaminase (isomerizing) [Clostridiales bacterium]
MCGIIGYVGKEQASPILIDGLKKLEYRGYDSSGIAVLDNGVISTVKSVGKIAALEAKTAGKAPSGTIGIGHTRWATHGKPSEINSHPHSSHDGRFAIVHNGIIENYAEIKAELTGLGYTFKSETDSETIAHLIQHLYCGDMVKTLTMLIKRLKGAYAVAILGTDSPNTLYAIRKDNPLIVGIGNNENFITSDITAALSRTHDFVRLNDGEIAMVSADEAKFFNSDGRPIKKTPAHYDIDARAAEKDGYDHFMLKEIYEQPHAIDMAVRTRIKNKLVHLDNVKFDKAYLEGLTKIDIVGCGSAYHAGIVGKTFIEKLCRIPVDCILASEYIYSDPIVDERTLTVVISQSGETADTVAALRLAKKLGSRTLAIVNVVNSTIAVDADDVLYTYAGPEIAVATTKGYTTQVGVLYLIGLEMARILGTVTEKRYAEIAGRLEQLHDKVAETLNNTTVNLAKKYADKYADKHCIFFIGRGADYAASLEAALKLKEISYIHAESYAAGELKHGTISLIEKSTLTIALTTQSALYHKMESNIKAVKAREGDVLAVASRTNSKINYCVDGMITIPECDDDLSPVLTAVVLQLFAYYVAKKRGCDIDKPRNLAKSVTVE